MHTSLFQFESCLVGPTSEAVEVTAGGAQDVPVIKACPCTRRREENVSVLGPKGWRMCKSLSSY